jgi:hypothetical protein
MGKPVKPVPLYPKCRGSEANFRAFYRILTLCETQCQKYYVHRNDVFNKCLQRKYCNLLNLDKKTKALRYSCAYHSVASKEKN